MEIVPPAAAATEHTHPHLRLRVRVGCHRDFPAGCGVSGQQHYWSGSGTVSCKREFPAGCGPPPRIRVIESASAFFDGVRVENAGGVVGSVDDGVKGNKNLVPAKRGGEGWRGGVVSESKRLKMMDKEKGKEKGKDVLWRRPVNAVRSKIILDGIVKKPFSSTSRAVEVSGRMESGFGKGRNAGEGSAVNVGSVDRAREAVRETLRLYRCHILMIASGGGPWERKKRIDFQAKKELEVQGKLSKPVKVVGAMPGVEVGDEFYYRVELFIIGLHGRLQNGIDYLEKHGSKLATCVVATEGYYDDMTESEFLEYTGEGGVYMDKGKQPDDQKMTGGNLALKNSMMSKSPVRVVRGFKAGFRAGDPDPRTAKTTYVYDGLYDVMDCKKAKGSKGNLIYMFTLRRHPSQPVVRWKKYKH